MATVEPKTHPVRIHPSTAPPPSCPGSPSSHLNNPHFPFVPVYPSSQRPVTWRKWYIERRWQLLFPFYRRIDLPGLRGFALIELIVIALYTVINVTLSVTAVVQMTFTSDPDTLVDLGNLVAIYGTVNVLLLLFPVTRSSVLNLLLGISFERAVFYHKWLARVAILQLGLHGAAVYASQYDLQDTFYYASHPGTISLLLGLMLVVCSLRPFRRRLHRWFLRLHLVLFLSFVLVGFVHNSLVCIVLVSLVLYAWDWVLRLLMWRRPTRVLDITPLPGGVTRLRFQMPAGAFRYHGGQFCWVCIPLVSPWEWHPFSLSSSPHHEVLMLHIKTLGQWTERLEELAKRTDVEWKDVKMYVEGPYGSISLPLDRYTNVLMVAGGIGITPLGSIYNDLLRVHYLGTRTLQRMRLIWSVRDLKLISSLYTDVRQADKRHYDPINHHKQLSSPSFFSTRQSLETLDDSASAAAPPASPGHYHRHLQSNTVVPLANKLHCAFYVTAQATGSLQSTQGNKWEEHVHGGRPDLVQSFQQMAQAMAEDEQQGEEAVVKRCAVLACGPAEMISQVQRLCCRHSTPLVKFDLHQETFLW
jgi:predicted ferric reductase